MNRIESSKFPSKRLKELLTKRPQYGANETGIERTSADQPRYVRITDIDEFGRLIEDGFGKTAENIETRYFLKNNDLLFARSGNTVGKSYLHKQSKTNYECFFAGYMIRFVIDALQVSPDYLFYFTQTRTYQHWVNGIKRTAGQPNINAEEYKSLLVPVPPSKVQGEVIEKFIKAYQEKAAKEAEAKLRLASIDGVILDALGITLPEADDGALRNRIFYTKSAAVTGTRIDPHFSSPYFLRFDEAVRNYPYRQLNEVAKFSNEVWDQESIFGDVFPYIEIGEIDLAFGQVNATTYLEKADAPSRAKMIAKPNDILISTTRPNRGAIALLDDEFDCRIASTGFAIIRNTATSVSRKYLFHVLRHRISLTQMDRRSSGGNYPAITLDELEKIIIPLPPPEVQAEIADRVDAIYREAKQLRSEGDEILANAKAEVEKMILA